MSAYLASAGSEDDQRQREARLDAGVGPAIGRQLAQHAHRLQRHGAGASPRSPSPQPAAARPRHTPPATPPRQEPGWPAPDGALHQPLPREPAETPTDRNGRRAATRLQARWRGVIARRRYWARLEAEIVALSAEVAGLPLQAPPTSSRGSRGGGGGGGISLLDGRRLAEERHRAEVEGLAARLAELQSGPGQPERPPPLAFFHPPRPCMHHSRAVGRRGEQC